MASKSSDGYIYILSNPAMPGLLKIGMTAGDPFQRARDLHTTGVPTAFKVEAAIHVANAREAETRLHKKFINQRHMASREFFSIDLKDIFNKILHFINEPSQSDSKTLAQEVKLEHIPQKENVLGIQVRELFHLHGLSIIEVSAHLGMSNREVQRIVNSIQPLRLRHAKFGDGVFMQGFHEGEQREVQAYFPGIGQKRMLLKTSGLICI